MSKINNGKRNFSYAIALLISISYIVLWIKLGYQPINALPTWLI